MEDKDSIKAPQATTQGRQTFCDDAYVDVMPVQTTNVKIMEPATTLQTFCTSPDPEWFYCTYDKKEMVSEVEFKTDKCAFCCWLLFIILLFPFSILCCCLCPFIGYHTIVHRCPECKRQVGKARVM